MAVEPTTETSSAKVFSVNVGQVRGIEWLGKKATTAIWKSPVAGRVALAGVNFAGDDQADRRVHGGRDKAVYSYAREDEEWWEEELGRPLEPGAFGENLTFAGVNVTGAVIGERWEIGSALLEVAQPRIPCWKLGARMNDPHFPPVFAAAGRPGAYLRIIREGDIAAGDLVTVVYRPSHNLTVGDVARIYHSDHSQAHLLLNVPRLADMWPEWARRIIRHSAS
ncbi:MAG TPA: MOSC domain-containing protein [Chloroflexia bacterium]|nr:MOSC domain-containing protein [Chloroflexia bacterium]